MTYAALAHLGERQTEDSLVIWRYCVRATEAAFIFFHHPTNTEATAMN